MTKMTKLEQALAPLIATEAARKDRFERICDKLIVSGKLTLVDLDAGTVEYVAPVTLGEMA